MRQKLIIVLITGTICFAASCNKWEDLKQELSSDSKDYIVFAQVNVGDDLLVFVVDSQNIRYSPLEKRRDTYLGDIFILSVNKKNTKLQSYVATSINREPLPLYINDGNFILDANGEIVYYNSETKAFIINEVITHAFRYGYFVYHNIIYCSSYKTRYKHASYNLETEEFKEFTEWEDKEAEEAYKKHYNIDGYNTLNNLYDPEYDPALTLNDIRY